MDPVEAKQLFYEWVWPQRSALLRIARVLCGTAEDADDLTQETLMKAFGAIERFRPDPDDGAGSVRRWLVTILRNARLDRLRTKSGSAKPARLDDLGSEPARARPDEPPPEWEHPQELVNAFSDQEVIEALQALPEEIRWTLLLVDVEGLDQREAAGWLDVPVGTIKSRLHRGRGMLRGSLDRLARDRRLLPERRAR